MIERALVLLPLDGLAYRSYRSKKDEPLRKENAVNDSGGDAGIDLDEAMQISNDTRYGLSASGWTRDIGKAMTAIRGPKAGTVWVNSRNTLDSSALFGGFKHSGIGREHGRAALEGCLEIKTIITRCALS